MTPTPTVPSIDPELDRRTRTATLGQLLREQAVARSDHPFLLTRARSFTFGELALESNRVAHGLAGLGVKRGSRVMVLLPNRAEMVVAWFALAKLGAVLVPLNAAFKGPSLAAMINQTAAELLITDSDRLAHTAELAGELSGLTTVILLDGRSEVRHPWRQILWTSVRSDRTDDPPVVARPSDPVMFLFTSGTTGRSKACVLSHRYVLRHAALMASRLELTPREINYTAFPLYYIDATVYAIGSALVLGATAAIGERFSASQFWDDIRLFGATNFDFVGATLAFLAEQPKTADDRRHSVRLAWGIPLPPDASEFEARFGFPLIDGYGLTEAGVPIWRPLRGDVPSGSSGRVCPDLFDVRILDDEGHEAPIGAIGEIAIRPLEPSIVIDGYFGNPDATVALFHDLWLHTGDLGRFDAEGFFYFEGRKKDMIRRRGQNISAFEIEEVVNGHPAVLESAAFGVASDVSEEEVMVVVCLNQGMVLDPAELAAHCAARLAGYMVPRYIEVAVDLPRTTTDKVSKAPLKARGVTASTWERAAGR